MPIDQRPPAIFLMGPTAAGKTALACALVERFPLDLISVDSALVYRGLDVGSAKPDAATLARFPHRLIDIRDPGQAYSAAEFRADALREMQAIGAAGRTPLLVGGTGLYFRALQYGLSTLPAADAALRVDIAQSAQAQGWPALHARLHELDATAAARIKPNDAQRIQRALEVITLTGKPLSALQGAAPARCEYRVLKLALVPADRAALHARIATRMDAMFEQGFLDEVRGLRARGNLHPDLPSMRAVGYRQAWQHLDGQFDATQLHDRAIFATRQLAKRQLTWLRAELDARAVDPFDTSYHRVCEEAVKAFLDRP
jgi:tRNA dimethylallyltransferase